MKIKNVVSFSLLLCSLSLCIMLCGFTFFKKADSNNSVPVVQQTEKISDIQDKVWCITFQLVWNDFMDKMMDSKPVEFVGGNPVIADELNKRLYSSDDISSNSYYKTQGKISPKLKKEIINELYKKLKEKSDILDMINWNAKDSYLFYVMLKKDFNFLTDFDKLKSAPFNLSEEKVKYFGIEKNSDAELRKNVSVLLYNSENEYAVKLLTKENEEVLLFRTDKNDTFENLYAYISSNKSEEAIKSGDILRVPNIIIDKTISYDALCGRKIVGSDYIISQALQTIKFKMDNKGGSLKSEAAIVVMKMALMPPDMHRVYSFDKDRKSVV